MTRFYRATHPLLPLALFLTIASVATAAATKPFVSLRGYQILAAPGWQINDTGAMGTDVVIYTAKTDGFEPNLNVIVGPAPAGVSLERARDITNEQMARSLADYKQLSQSIIMMDGVRAIDTVAEHSTGASGKRLYLHRVIAIKGGEVYSFSCSSLAANHAKYDNAFDQMLHSIRWHAPVHAGG